MQQVKASLKGKFARFPLVAFGSVEASPDSYNCPGVQRGEGFHTVPVQDSMAALCSK